MTVSGASPFRSASPAAAQSRSLWEWVPRRDPAPALSAAGRLPLGQGQPTEILGPHHPASIPGPGDERPGPAGLAVPEARQPHHPGHVGGCPIAAVALGQAPHHRLGLLVAPPVGDRVPEELVAVLRAAENVGGAGKSAPPQVLEHAGVACGAVLVEVKLQPPDLGDVLFLPPPGPGPDRVDAKVDVIVPRAFKMPQPGLHLPRGCLRQGKDTLLGVAGRARDGKDGDAVPGGMGEHAVDELGRLILFHCRSSSAAMPRDPSRVSCRRRRLPGQLPAHRLPVLSSDRQANLTPQRDGNHLHPATGPGSDPWAASPLRLFLPGPMALERLPGASGPSRGLPPPPGNRIPEISSRKAITQKLSIRNFAAGPRDAEACLRPPPCGSDAMASQFPGSFHFPVRAAPGQVVRLEIDPARRQGL